MPHATELLFALGLGDDVVAVTHECDFPLEVLELPRVTRDVLPAGPRRRPRSTRPSASGPSRARRSTSSTRTAGGPRARPHRHAGAVRRLRRLLRRRRRGRRAARDGAARHLARPQDARRGDGRHPHDRPGDRRPRRRARARHAPARPDRRGPARRQGRGPGPRSPRSNGSTRCSSPATGRRRSSSSRAARDVLGFAGEHSEQSTWEIVAAARPEVVVVMPCGYDAERSREEALRYAAELRGDRREAGRRGRRGGVLLAPRPAPRGRPRAHGARAAPGPRARGAGRGVRDRRLTRRCGAASAADAAAARDRDRAHDRDHREHGARRVAERRGCGGCRRSRAPCRRGRRR